MTTVFITGVSGYFGSKLVSFFDRKQEVDHIVGIDVRKPAFTSGKFEFMRHDVRNDMAPILEGRNIDWAVHAAWILPPTHNKALMEDINVTGTNNFLDACVKSGVGQMLYCSSTTAYGFHPDNPRLLKEESPLRGNDDFTYSKNKKEMEFVCAKFKKSNPSASLTVVRPCFVVGPGFNNPLARHLQKKIVMLPSKTVPFQFIHEDDLVEIMYLLLKQKKDGIYNLAADGTMTFDEMIRMLGNWQLKIPSPLMYPLNSLMWHLRASFITEFPSPGLNLVSYPWIASNAKIKKELKYKFKYPTTKKAFEDFVRHVHAEK